MTNNLTLVCLTVLLLACNRPAPQLIKGPASDLCHIDIILDSSTYQAIKNDPFMQKEFGVLNVDTAYYGGKPSYDLYLLGNLNFLHLSLAKGFWKNQAGGGVLVFQTRKPGMIDSVLISWKQFYKDSLTIHTYKSSDFTLDEVMTWHKSDSLKPKAPTLFANLTSYSADAYRNWGISDSIVNAGLSMKRFMESWAGDELKDKLFHSIEELHMTINPKELKEIRSALLANGYRQDEDTFTHAYSPIIYVSISEDVGRPKYSKVKFSVNDPTLEKEIVFSSRATLKLRSGDGWFIFN